MPFLIGWKVVQAGGKWCLPRLALLAVGSTFSGKKESPLETQVCRQFTFAPMPFAKYLLPLLLIFAACKSDAPPPSDRLNLPAETTLLLQQNDSLRSVIQVLQEKENAAAGTPGALPEAAETLSRYGLPAEPAALAAHLQAENPALFSPAGLQAESALPLRGNFVFVAASDGYNYHYALLQYKAQTGKGISWQQVWTDTP